MLHALYLDDIARYAPPMQRVRVRDCYLSLPRQFAKENTKFQYAVVERRTGARKYAGSVDWLVASGVVLRCRAVSAPTWPLASYETGERFRLYANDTGLLMAMYDFDMKRSVVYDTLTGPTRGGLYENLIAVLLTAQGVPLRYWTSANVSHRIEFLGFAGRAGRAHRGQGLQRFVRITQCPTGTWGHRTGYRLVDGNVGRVGKKVTLPYYLTPYLYR